MTDAAVTAPSSGEEQLLAPVVKRRMLIVVNPYATTVSARLKHLVVYALKGHYDVEVADTASPLHAMKIAKGLGERDFDLVCAFGGDGTVNEVANGLAGGDVPMTALPGGKTNVFCRTLGIPNDVVDATEHLLAMADRFEVRRVDLGRVNGRYFTFSSGVGLDADVVKRVDQHPRLKSRVGEYYFAWAALSGFYSHYRARPPRLMVEVPGTEDMEVMTVVVQNSDPFTYFGARELHVGNEVALDSHTLSLVGLKRARERDVPGVAYRLLSKRAAVTGHRQIVSRPGVTRATVRSLPRREGEEPLPVPLQVDGDYLEDVLEAEYSVEAGALAVVS